MLNPAALRESIRPFFSPGTMPRGPMPQVVVEWALAYITYAQTAVAGPCLPGPLSPVPAEGEFFRAMDDSLRAMWLATPWAGPGFVGTTASVPSLAAHMEANMARLLQSYDPDLALSVITDVLHTYTTQITVTLTSVGGASSLVSIV